MTILDEKGRITRRGFLELGSGVVATAGMLVRSNAAKGEPEKPHLEEVDAGPILGKIALDTENKVTLL